MCDDVAVLAPGHIEVVKLLASHGAEVACKDKKFYTPLHAAASSGMISVVKYLLDLGVDVSSPTHLRLSALFELEEETTERVALLPIFSCVFAPSPRIHVSRSSRPSRSMSPTRTATRRSTWPATTGRTWW